MSDFDLEKVKKIFINNDFYSVRQIDIKEFKEFDPLEIVIRDIKRFNNFTIQIVGFLIDNYDFPKSSEYINLLLERYTGIGVEEKILERVFDISELDQKTIALSKDKNVFDKIVNLYKEKRGVDTYLLNLLDNMENITKQICGKSLSGNVIILETDRGMIWADRDKLKIDTFYKQDLEYSMTHDGDMNFEKPIYRFNIDGRIFFVEEKQKNIIMNNKVITFSSYLDRNILVVQWGEPPESVDLYTFIPRDNCELYLLFL